MGGQGDDKPSGKTHWGEGGEPPVRARQQGVSRTRFSPLVQLLDIGHAGQRALRNAKDGKSPLVHVGYGEVRGPTHASGSAAALHDLDAKVRVDDTLVVDDPPAPLQGCAAHDVIAKGDGEDALQQCIRPQRHDGLLALAAARRVDADGPGVEAVAAVHRRPWLPGRNQREGRVDDVVRALGWHGGKGAMAKAAWRRDEQQTPERGRQEAGIGGNKWGCATTCRKRSQ